MKKIALLIIATIFIGFTAPAQQSAKDYYMQAKLALEDGNTAACLSYLQHCQNAIGGSNIKIEGLKAQAYTVDGNYISAQIAYNAYMNFASQIGFTDHPKEMVDLGNDISTGLANLNKEYKDKLAKDKTDNLQSVQNQIAKDDDARDNKFKKMQDGNTKNMYNKAMDSRSPDLLVVFKEEAPGSTLSAKVNTELDKQSNPNRYIVEAVTNKDISEAAFLVSKGADVNYKNTQGKRLLHIAVSNDDKAMVKKLLDLGAEIEFTDNADNTPLLLAVIENLPTMANYLISLGSNVKASAKGVTALQYAVFNNITITVPLLLEKGCNPNEKFKVGTTEYTPLYYAVYKHQNKTITADLLKNGANANDYGMGSWTALMAAVHNKNLDMVNLLLSYKADANINGPKNWTALHFAARENLADIATALLKHGASKKNRDVWGRTAARVAYENDQKTALKAIRQY